MAAGTGFSHAVLIGRFQPFHLGHQALFDRARTLADQVVVVLGSAFTAPSQRNPWTATEREGLIRASVDTANCEFLPIADSAYNLSHWRTELQTKVHRLVGSQTRLVLVGHTKDPTSYYLNLFPEWGYESLPSFYNGLNAADIRNALFEGRFETVQSSVAPDVADFLAIWIDSPLGRSLREEYAITKAYRESWAVAPYPPILVTTDALVMWRNEILVVRRGRHPGKGLLALPGGFLEPEESIDQAIVRELVEETGIKLEAGSPDNLIRQRQVFDRPDRDPRGRVVSHVGYIRLEGANPPLLRAGDDAQEAFWLPLAEVFEFPERFFSDHALIIRWFIGRHG